MYVDIITPISCRVSPGCQNNSADNASAQARIDFTVTQHHRHTDLACRVRRPPIPLADGGVHLKPFRRAAGNVDYCYHVLTKPFSLHRGCANEQLLSNPPPAQQPRLHRSRSFVLLIGHEPTHRRHHHILSTGLGEEKTVSTTKHQKKRLPLCRVCLVSWLAPSCFNTHLCTFVEYQRRNHAKCRVGAFPSQCGRPSPPCRSTTAPLMALLDHVPAARTDVYLKAEADILA